jgi:hypothetical protein
MHTMTPTTLPEADEAARRRAANLRTARVFASIAVTFFVGIIAARSMGSPMIGIGIMGATVLLFLAFAIGRNLWSRK